MKPLEYLATLWSNRTRSDPAIASAALSAVANLKPIVVITGGSRGIGYALAEHFAVKGHDVALVARSSDDLKAAAERIRTSASAREVLTVALDITLSDAADLIEAHLRASGFYLDILVNNAGLGRAGSFEAASQADLKRLADLNVDTPTRLMAHVLPGMLGRRRGGVLNVGSLGGTVPGPGQAAYYASKAYLQSLSEAVAAECSGLGVRVSILLPGPVNTDFHERMGAQNSPYRQLLPGLSPQHVARAGYNGFFLAQRIIVPGVFNKVMYLAVRFLPHPLTVPLVKFLLSGSHR